MLVVADTSPLNYLIWIDSVEILQQLYGTVLIPLEVRDELLAADAPAVVRSWANNLPDWIEVCAADPTLRDDPRWQFLDLGERAAIALAIARAPSILLIDERRGTEVAHSQGLPVTGTLGILDEASRRRLISLPEVVERLKRTSFRYPTKIVERLLAEDAQRRSGRQE
jgi:predicted nucleic acid-binding protein